jgi:hypothetical protein
MRSRHPARESNEDRGVSSEAVRPARASVAVRKEQRCSRRASVGAFLSGSAGRSVLAQEAQHMARARAKARSKDAGQRRVDSEVPGLSCPPARCGASAVAGGTPRVRARTVIMPVLVCDRPYRGSACGASCWRSPPAAALIDSGATNEANRAVERLRRGLPPDRTSRDRRGALRRRRSRFRGLLRESQGPSSRGCTEAELPRPRDASPAALSSRAQAYLFGVFAIHLAFAALDGVLDSGSPGQRRRKVSHWAAPSTSPPAELANWRVVSRVGLPSAAMWKP